ncbi:hypothetical protein OPV22_002741 [Ensete ventricosum]|uniref:Uncharacterized protein n=1 Tax=Ensete ventricosum TaxID=4639 RepID=A0AAV8RYL7_ENSVE|nr:hypothetical protein OPV22_002741 [Ensete ventricosum]
MIMSKQHTVHHHHMPFCPLSGKKGLRHASDNTESSDKNRTPSSSPHDSINGYAKRLSFSSILFLLHVFDIGSCLRTVTTVSLQAKLLQIHDYTAGSTSL